jgi:hypothetical protein
MTSDENRVATSRMNCLSHDHAKLIPREFPIGSHDRILYPEYDVGIEILVAVGKHTSDQGLMTRRRHHEVDMRGSATRLSTFQLPLVRAVEFHGPSKKAADRSVAGKAESDPYFGQGIHGSPLQDGDALTVGFDEAVLE